VVLGIAAGLGIFAGPQEVVDAYGGELFDGCPVLLGKFLRSGHVHELEEDGGVDGPYSVGSRICSGEGTEKVSDTLGSLLSWLPN